MEILICFYIVFSYLVMIGYTNALREYKEWSIKDKTETVILVLIVLFAPFMIPFMIGNLLYKLMKY